MKMQQKLSLKYFFSLGMFSLFILCILTYKKKKEKEKKEQ